MPEPRIKAPKEFKLLCRYFTKLVMELKDASDIAEKRVSDYPDPPEDWSDYDKYIWEKGRLLLEAQARWAKRDYKTAVFWKKLYCGTLITPPARIACRIATGFVDELNDRVRDLEQQVGWLPADVPEPVRRMLERLLNTARRDREDAIAVQKKVCG